MIMRGYIFKKSLVFALILLFVGASVLPSISGYIENIVEKNSSSFLRIKTQSKNICTSTITKDFDIIQNQVVSGSANLDNIAVANSIANESYPSMVMKGINGLVAYEFKDGTKPFIYLKNTKDFGKNWSDSYILFIKYNNIYPTLNSPSLSINPGTGYTYGAFLSDYNTSGICGVFELSDISGDISITRSMITDWSNIGDYSFWGFKDINIKYHSFNDNVPWIESYIGSTNYYDSSTGSGPCNNAVMFNYLDSTNPYHDVTWIQWEPAYGNCSNLSVAMSDNHLKIYGVSEIINGSNIDLLYFSGSYIIDSHDSPSIDLDYYSFTGSEDLYHPNIYVKGNNIYIAAENNLREIILFKSTNSGNNWLRYNLTSEILPPDSNPKYPNLFADKTTLYCTFIESGNISITSSTIDKINWTKPVQLNNIDGSVVSKYRFSEIIDMNHIVWTDDRNDNLDIYLYIPEGLVPPNTPTISGPTKLKPNQNKEFTFTTTDPNGDQIYYYIDWGDGTTTDWQGPYESGYQLKLSNRWTYKAKFTIKCKAKDINGQESDYGILDISTPRSRILNANFLILLENHPKLFQILQKLLNRLGQ
jgi:hypothetical protein